MFEMIKPGTQIDFMSKRKLWAGLSFALIVMTFILLFTKGLNYGIDFTGGAEVQMKVPATWDIGKVRNSLSDGGLKNFKVQQIGAPSESQYIVKTEGNESKLGVVKETVDAIMKKEAPGGDYRIEKADVVGAAAGSSLRMSGVLSMIYAMICILIYVAIRFDARYAPGAVVALFHDTVIVIGIFILTQKQFDLQILAAILALIGYSNNDTIIVFDRIREELHANPSLGIIKVVNKSINETLGRTILTLYFPRRLLALDFRRKSAGRLCVHAYGRDRRRNVLVGLYRKFARGLHHAVSGAPRGYREEREPTEILRGPPGPEIHGLVF